MFKIRINHTKHLSMIFVSMFINVFLSLISIEFYIAFMSGNAIGGLVFAILVPIGLNLLFAKFQKSKYNLGSYCFFGIITYWVKSILERGEKYAGIFHLEKLISYHGINFEPDNTKRKDSNWIYEYDSKKYEVHCFNKSVIYENHNTCITADHKYLSIIYCGYDIYIPLKEFNKYKYWGFMFWHLIILEKISNLDAFNMEMAELLIEKI